ncbi:MAG: hypothetical protein NVV73_12360 [Cellvibrionaceae bacterium]|nr:hypothetical protein [Cellvibrionaceae bacterium]
MAFRPFAAVVCGPCDGAARRAWQAFSATSSMPLPRASTRATALSITGATARLLAEA